MMKFYLSPECQMATNYIIEKTKQYNTNKLPSKQVSLTMERIQTLLYFFQIEHIKKTGKLMFEDEFYAWPSGPAIPTTYDVYNVPSFFRNDISTTQVSTELLSKEQRQIIDLILLNTYDIDTIDLEILSCTIDTLWADEYDSSDKHHRQVIFNEKLLNYYETQQYSIKKLIEIFDLVRLKQSKKKSAAEIWYEMEERSIERAIETLNRFADSGKAKVKK